MTYCVGFGLHPKKVNSKTFNSANQVLFFP